MTGWILLQTGGACPHGARPGGWRTRAWTRDSRTAPPPLGDIHIHPPGWRWQPRHRDRVQRGRAASLTLEAAMGTHRTAAANSPRRRAERRRGWASASEHEPGAGLPGCSPASLRPCRTGDTWRRARVLPHPRDLRACDRRVIRRRAARRGPSRRARRLASRRAVRASASDVLRPLGCGGMGVVYEALDRQRDTRVALKTLHHVDAAGLFRFKKSSARCRTCTRNLVTLGELFEDRGHWFFTMELVEGSSFLDRSAAGRAARRAPAARGAARSSRAALAALHARGQGAPRRQAVERARHAARGASCCSTSG